MAVTAHSKFVIELLCQKQKGHLKYALCVNGNQWMRLCLDPSVEISWNLADFLGSFRSVLCFSFLDSILSMTTAMLAAPPTLHNLSFHNGKSYIVSSITHFQSEEATS